MFDLCRRFRWSQVKQDFSEAVYSIVLLAAELWNVCLRSEKDYMSKFFEFQTGEYLHRNKQELYHRFWIFSDPYWLHKSLDFRREIAERPRLNFEPLAPQWAALVVGVVILELAFF